MRPHSIHPFPARMAPEIVLHLCESLPEHALVLDPMIGSGVVMRVAAEYGLQGLGFDIDPLAVLISKVWTQPIDLQKLVEATDYIIESACNLELNKLTLHWIDEDKETSEFIDFWFGQRQRDDLRKLCFILQGITGSLGNLMRLALSRIIIKKEKGASLAADISHSRPHRVYAEDTYDFDVFSAFRKSVIYLEKWLNPEKVKGNIKVSRGDARNLEGVADNYVDAIISSPPYLNAIDYLRGHKLSLVWLGYQIRELRSTRSNSIGAGRRPNLDSDMKLAAELTACIDPDGLLTNQVRQIVNRYALDINASMQESYRVLKAGGEMTLVVGNSTRNGVYIENTEIVIAAAKRAGFHWLRNRSHEREILPSRRYLPLRTKNSASAMDKRMWIETVLTFRKD